VLRNSATSWGAPAKLLHWTVAALVFAQMPLGWAAASWRLSPTKLDLFVWHKSTGLLILALMIVRLAWRLANPVPALPAEMPLWERRAAAAGHAALYLLVILMPLSGWIAGSAAGIPFRLFRLVPVPALVAPDRAVADAAASAHVALLAVLALLLCVHIGAALRHHYLRRSDVLARMLPGRGAVE
jgi:cytochrome b561